MLKEYLLEFQYFPISPVSVDIHLFPFVHSILPNQTKPKKKSQKSDLENVRDLYCKTGAKKRMTNFKKSLDTIPKSCESNKSNIVKILVTQFLSAKLFF